MFQCLIGLFIGADQPVSQAIVTELSTPETRSKRLSFLMLAWYVGALTAIAAECLLLLTGKLEATGAWHTFYDVPTVLCLASLPLRHRLMKGFHSTQSSPSAGSVPSLKPYRKAILFCCGFWTCQTLPVTAVMFYSPVILESVTGNPNQLFQVTLIYLGFLAGTLPVLKFGDRLPTRWILVGTFAAMTAWLGRQYLRSLCAAVLDICFGLYAHCVRNAVDVGYSLPMQLFPTAVRTTAVGIVFSVSRVASVVAAVGFPLLLKSYNVAEILVAGTGIALTEGAMTWISQTSKQFTSRQQHK